MGSRSFATERIVSMKKRLLDGIAWFAFIHAIFCVIPIVSVIVLGYNENDSAIDAAFDTYSGIVGFGVMGSRVFLYSPLIWMGFRFFTGKSRLIPWENRYY